MRLPPTWGPDSWRSCRSYAAAAWMRTSRRRSASGLPTACMRCAAARNMYVAIKVVGNGWRGTRVSCLPARLVQWRAMDTRCHKGTGWAVRTASLLLQQPGLSKAHYKMFAAPMLSKPVGTLDAQLPPGVSIPACRAASPSPALRPSAWQLAQLRQAVSAAARPERAQTIPPRAPVPPVPPPQVPASVEGLGPAAKAACRC